MARWVFGVLLATMLTAGCGPSKPRPEEPVAAPVAQDVDIEGLASFIDGLPRWEEAPVEGFIKHRQAMCSAYRNAAVVLSEYSVEEISVVLGTLSRRAGASRSTMFLLTRFMFEFPEKPLARVEDRAGFLVDPKGGPTSESWPITRDIDKRWVISDPFRGTSGRFNIVKDLQDAAAKYSRRPAAEFQPEVNSRPKH